MCDTCLDRILLLYSVLTSYNITCFNMNKCTRFRVKWKSLKNITMDVIVMALCRCRADLYVNKEFDAAILYTHIVS